MEKIVIRGGKPLKGEIEISGMKNAALPIIFGCLLVKDSCIIENLPDIDDVRVALTILKDMGATVNKLSENVFMIDATAARSGSSSVELVRKIRASYYLLGAEIGRYGKAHVGVPGGCDFGIRPIDQHIKGFEALGCKVRMDGGYVELAAPNGLHGSSIFFDLVSVGATMNVMLAAVCTPGLTVIENAAREPHIVDLANFLNTCGGQISGAGTDTIKVKGVDTLHGCTYAIIPDMIEAGTYMMAAAATKGELKITNVIPRHLESITAKLCEMGVDVTEGDDYVVVKSGKRMTRVNVKTQPYPGFPTDMQPQMAVLMCLADGISQLNESVFDNRFRYTEELMRMGALIKVNGKVAMIEGIPALRPARVRAVDLRAGAAMVIAGLATRGTTEIDNIHLIERGYDDLVGKLRACGADIERVEERNI
ncbi:MAG: UDP-N-acetylglucosamine 1-carboxyvinyltransferase [Clostridia bacterium]|nr:UDP-N-acetylglucosamine 1-carboxyvinyltransferase [Clostridia bacterium]